MSPLQRSPYSFGISSAIAASAIIGFAFFVSGKNMKQIFKPVFSWIRMLKTKTLFKPANIITVENQQQCSKAMKTILRYRFY